VAERRGKNTDPHQVRPADAWYTNQHKPVINPGFQNWNYLVLNMINEQ